MRTDLPRVPGGMLFGNLAELREDRVGLLLRAVRDVGPLARLRMGVFPALLVSTPGFAHGVLVEHADAFHKGFGLSIFAKPMLGEGLLTSEGAFHKRQRRLLAPAFMHKRIAGYAETFGTYAERARKRIAPHAELDLAEEMMQLTFEIVGKTLFDADVSGDAAAVGEALTEAMHAMMAQLTSALPLPPGFPSPQNLRMRRAVRRLDRVVYRLIEERRKSEIDRGDVLSMLLLAREPDDQGGMADKQVRDEAMTVMLAGHETTANALTWTFALLARHPEVRVRLEQELDRVLGGRIPNVDDLPNLPYALQVLKEAMRLYPPAYLLTRRAQRDVEIDGVRVSRGELVIVNILGMQRDPEYFENPQAFEPERFAPAESQRWNKGAYLPFGGGARVCIGNHFALMEGQILLAHLAQHFRFEPLSARPLEPEGLITLRPKGGLKVRAHPRHASAQHVAE
ncbi:MAG: cytochrome P450 [Myxococcales bacterium]